MDSKATGACIYVCVRVFVCMYRTGSVYTSQHADKVVNITFKSMGRLCFFRRKTSMLKSTLMGFVGSWYFYISDCSYVYACWLSWFRNKRNFMQRRVLHLRLFSFGVIILWKNFWLFPTDFEGSLWPFCTPQVMQRLWLSLAWTSHSSSNTTQLE